MGQNNFDFFLPTKILFGEGRASQAGEAISMYGRVCMIVTTKWNDVKGKAFEEIIKTIKSKGVKVIIFDKALPNPTLSSIMKGVAIAKQERVDVLVGLGGGSAIDTAKAIALGATHEGSPWDYLFFKEQQPTAATLPIIAITTTSGSGSHVTKVSVLTNEETNTKSAIGSTHIFPKVAIVDPRLMISKPPYLTAVSGFDAFTHAFESYININSNMMIDAIAVEAIRIIVQYLKESVKNGSDVEVRRMMAYADTLAGITIANVGTTLPHAMGQPISGHAPHVSHGEALALVYPEFLDFTYSSCIEKFATIARIFKPSLVTVSDYQAAKELCECVVEFQKEIGLSLTLSSLRVCDEDIDAIIDDCMDFPDMHINPAVPSREELFVMFDNMRGE